MTDLRQAEGVTAENESSLQDLSWAIEASKGQFSLIRVRCNYASLRQRMAQQLRELCSVEIRELVLKESVKTLYTTIRAELGNEQPAALMVLGLESVSDIDRVLTSTNQVREEFRKNFPFPLVLWVNDEVLQKLIRLAPDFESWSTTTEFVLATDTLIRCLEQKAKFLFVRMLDAGASQFLTNTTIFGVSYRWELQSALKDLQSHGQQLEPALEASLQFVWGRDAYVSDQIDQALEHYRQSLTFWQQNNHLEQQGVLLFHMGLCHYRSAERQRADSDRYWQEARNFFQQCVEVFEQAKRPDLVAKFISQLGEVLQHLGAWQELQVLAEKSMELHQTYGTPVELAKDCGFLAEVALNQATEAAAAQAKQWAVQALQTLSQAPETQVLPQQGLYLLLLAKAQQQLGQQQESINTLETARRESNPQHNPQLYIRILEALRSLYFNKGQYLLAFRVKQEQRSIEQQYGFRAFIGAGQLQSKRQGGDVLVQADTPEAIAGEITASGRQQDVYRLLERISRNDHKLTVIYGQSGVGKSSLVQAGLMPALKQGAIITRNVLPILVSTYTDWIGELVRRLAEEIEGNRDISPLEFSQVKTLDSIIATLEKLQQNEANNLIIVLIFDQFEEFFFACNEASQRQQFWAFFQRCLNLSSVKLFLSIREDYIHYLLEGCRLVEVDYNNINLLQDILSSSNSYYLGNLSMEDAKSLIRSVTSRSQFALESKLIEQFVHDLAGEQKEVLPIELQVVGAQLQEERITTLEEYRNLGCNPKKKLVERSLDRILADCGKENEFVAWGVLYSLTNEKLNRPIKTKNDIATFLKITVHQFDIVLEIFVGSGLLFSLPEELENRYQIVHDYLVSPIRKKYEELQLSQTENQLNRILRRRVQEIRTLGVVIVVLLGVAVVFWIKAESQRKVAEVILRNQINTRSAYSKTFAASDLSLDVLIETVRGVQQLRQVVDEAKADTKIQLVTTLQLAVYGIREYNRLEGHSYWVSSVSFSPDRQLIVSASYDGTVKLWRRDGSLIKSLEGHRNSVLSASFSSDSQTIASASDDGTIKLWTRDGTLIRTWKGHKDSVRSVNFSPNGQVIASASDDGTIKLWRHDGTLIKSLNGHGNKVLDASFSPDGKTIASAGGDNTIKLWHSDGTLLKTLKGHSDWVSSVSFSPNGQVIASASYDGTVKLWRHDGTLIRTLKEHSRWVTSVSFSPDGQTIASASFDGTVKLWGYNKYDGTLMETFQGHTDRVRSVGFDRDGILASASDDGTVKLWNLSGISAKKLQAHGDEVTSLSFSPDGQTIASASDDGTIKLWSREGQELKTLKGHTDWVTSVSFSPDGQTIASASNDGTIKLWSREGQELKTLKGHTGWVTSVSFSPDGQTIASASFDRTVKLWSREGRELKTLKGHKDLVTSVSFSPDGQTIASASFDRTVKLWSREGQELKTLKRHKGRVHSLSFSPDGQILASASGDERMGDYTVMLWSRDGEELKTLRGHNSAVLGVTFSPDGKILASASDDHTVKLWNRNGQELLTLKGHNASVRAVTFSPDGRVLASASSASDDTTAILWDFDLDNLLGQGCAWLHDYLKTNSNLSESDRHLCDGIKRHT